MEKRTKEAKFIKNSWTNMNLRCGKYKHFGNKAKNRCYENISIEFSRDEYKKWCLERKNLILKLNKPSIDRINSNKNYSLDNIQIIELEDNIKKKRKGNKFINGPLSGTIRGVRKISKNRWSARITKNGKETHLGTFKSKLEALITFNNEFLKINGYEAFDIKNYVN